MWLIRDLLPPNTSCRRSMLYGAGAYYLVVKTLMWACRVRRYADTRLYLQLYCGALRGKTSGRNLSSCKRTNTSMQKRECTVDSDCTATRVLHSWFTFVSTRAQRTHGWTPSQLDVEGQRNDDVSLNRACVSFQCLFRRSSSNTLLVRWLFLGNFNTLKCAGTKGVDRLPARPSIFDGARRVHHRSSGRGLRRDVYQIRVQAGGVPYKVNKIYAAQRVCVVKQSSIYVKRRNK